MQKKESRKANMDAIRQNLKASNHLFSNNTFRLSIIQKTEKQEQQYSPQKQSNLIARLNLENSIHRDIDIFTERYQLLEKIGEGSNGLVRKCKQKITGNIYAVKMSTIDDQHILILKKNFKVIKSLNHPNIIKYKQMYISPKKRLCYLIMEYIPYQNLRKFKSFLDEMEIKNIIKQLLSAIQYMHKNFLCHRDIKLDNILYNRVEKKILIIDFGISKLMLQRGQIKQMWSPTGTIYYKAPEMLQGGGYTQSVDLWAVGIILYELITNQTPFYNQYLTETIDNILNMNISYNHQIWSNYCRFAKDLTCRLLKQHKKRLTATQALNAAWFIWDTNKNQSDLDDEKQSVNSVQILESPILNEEHHFHDFEKLFQIHKSNNQNEGRGVSRIFSINQQRINSNKSKQNITIQSLTAINQDIITH